MHLLVCGLEFIARRSGSESSSGIDLKRAGVLEPSNQDIKKEIAKTEELKKRTVIEEQEV